MGDGTPRVAGVGIPPAPREPLTPRVATAAIPVPPVSLRRTQVMPTVLTRAKDSPTSSQLLYESSLCIWQMTYLKPAAEAMAGPIVRLLVDVCRAAQKEKVFRMALSALRNLLNYDDLALASEMVDAGLNKVVIVRQLQSWGDGDVEEMLGYMDEKLRQGIQVRAMGGGTRR
jgi:V-type H+-transporting ATPase subunit H